MTITLRTKLVVSFLTVIAVTGTFATVVGVLLIGDRIVQEAQDKVAFDLNSARQIYQQTLADTENTLAFTAMREYEVKEALSRRDRELLLKSLSEAREKGKLDILTITDAEGKVVVRSCNPHEYGDDQSRDEIVGRVLSTRKPVAGTEIVPRKELLKESKELAARAHMKFIPTPRARPTPETESTSGMMLKAAVPLFAADGSFLGVLYGGILLNRNYEIVDKTKDIAYGHVMYNGKEVGTATIFQKDLRISTNVKLEDGSRAIRTRVSKEVYDRVIGEGKSWKARAFVVNDWYLTAYEPIRNINGEVIGILYVGILEKKYNDMKTTATLSFLGITVAGMFLALGIAYPLARTILKPIQNLQRGVEAVAAGDFDHEVQVSTADEIGALAASFNRLRLELKEIYEKLRGKIEAADEDLKRAYKELQERQHQLIHAEKLASLGALAAGVAHEINNPLGTISLYAQMTLDELNPDQESCRENLEIIMKHATRAAGIVKNLLEFARRGALEVRPLHINPLLESVLSMTAHHAKLHQVNVVKEFEGEGPRIVGDEDKLRQVFVNMVINAVQAMSDGGTLTIKSEFVDGGRKARISISDTGQGIPEENIEKIFDPFFTTKASSKGTGLGLAVSLGIVEQHKGTIEVRSKVGEGTTFFVTLPVSTEEEEEEE